MNEPILKNSRPRKIAASAEECRLEQNVPNPFQDFTEIRFSIPRRERVRLLIFDHHKKMMHELFDGRLRAGAYRVVWDGKTIEGEPFAEGCYTFKLEAGHFVALRKLEIGIKAEKLNDK